MLKIRPAGARPPGSTRWSLVLTLLALLPVLRAAPVTAADEFYLSLLRSGSRAMSDNEPERARLDLRVACFGLLEEPPLLSQCLARLGHAEAALSDRTAFRESFDRMAELERKFPGSYQQANLPAAARTEYEAAVARFIAESQLVALPAFEELAVRGAANRLAQMPTDKRREELERLIGESPNVERWRLMLGDVYLEERQYEAAIAHADAVLALEPTHPRARCLRGLAYADSGRCATGAGDLPFCPGSRSDRPTAEIVLTCQTDLGRWQEASAYFDTLPVDIRQTRRIARLGRQIAAAQPTAAQATAETTEPLSAGEGVAGEVAATGSVRPVGGTPRVDPPPGEPASQPAQPSTTSGAAATPMPKPRLGPTVVTLSAEDAREIVRARELAAAAHFKEEVEATLGIVRPVADGNPLHSETQALAGELAYRSGLWSEAIRYLSRIGQPLNQDRVLVFYLSVSYFESGRVAEAKQAFRRCCSEPGLSPVIEAYREKILAD